MSQPIKTSNDIIQENAEKAREEKLINEVLLLVKTLIYEQENIIKLIIDSLYEIGSTNLVNQKVRLITFNRSLKFITKISKPVFKIVVWYWFKNNCPTLITEWLHSQVAFPRVEPQKIEVVLEGETKDINSSIKLIEANQTDEVKNLHFQVKLLTGILLAVVTIFSGSFIWVNYSLQQSHLETVEKLRKQVKTLKSSLNQH
ncbi:MAG: hypothetical protein ACKO3K_08100 [Cuspidothrix sp.]